MRIILGEPLWALEDYDGEGLDGYRPVEFFVHPMSDVREKGDKSTFETHIFQAPSLGT